MKKGLLLIASIFSFSALFATKHVIVNLGQTFSPNDLTINLGDTVEWSLGGTHNVIEVSQATWFSNGNTALGGGFSTPFGGGTWVPAAVGVYYYVCEPHAQNGMKGKITVNPPLGVNEQSNITFNFYPNPASDILNIGIKNNSSDLVSYSLFSLSGQKIRSGSNIDLEQVQHTISIAVADLPRGVYMITVTVGGAERTRKIVLQ